MPTTPFFKSPASLPGFSFATIVPMSEHEQRSGAACREEAILAFWNERHIFEKSLTKDAPKGDFVFYDGPPFATGLPHYGHLLQSAIKDAIPRYRTMRGFRVPRQWGWDCHGLPIENIVEKELGTVSKKDIVAMGVKKFNDLCRERIFTFIHEWERIMPRFGRWADMARPYRTMDFEYMQSEWWAFKALYEKGLIYEDYRSMHICPRCETTLSQGEVAEGYKTIKDLSVTVKFKVKNPEKLGLRGDVYLLAWTTTPWTLPGNVALAVGAELSYGPFEQDGATYIRAVADGRWRGDELVDLEYEPLFDYYAADRHLKNREKGWKVYAADFITAESGTGIAHEAPTFGADDWSLLKREGLPFVQHVGMNGTFAPETGEFAGLDLKPRAKDRPEEIREADLSIVKHLEKEGKVFAYEKYEHSYPHCWRCDTALLNYATSSWFVAVEKMKSTLLQTAADIHWAPEHIKEGRWGQWLSGARDWSISRQRFWANTIPVWRCGACKKEAVFGSAEELREASGVAVADLHKEIVDDVTCACACGGVMRRVPDVLDTWFDSGSVPFATRGYGAAQAASGERLTAADFIGEAQDQCRAWFYYQHVLAGGLFGARAFKNCIVTGIVLAEDGKKMAKKLKNYPDPVAMIDTYGADAMRLYMLSSPVVRAESLNFSESEVAEIARKVFGRLENVLSFYQLYADGTVRDWRSEHVLDRWIIARLDQLIRESTAGYEAYQLDKAMRPLADFVDDVSVWYLRRSRERFKGEGEDRRAALATLRFVLHRMALVMAPAAPFFAEHLFQAIRESEDEESAHLASWPDVSRQPSLWSILFGDDKDRAIISQMETVRSVVTKALEARERAGIKVRQPLSVLTIPSGAAISARYFGILADEVNVKEVRPGIELFLDTAITPELRDEGKMRDARRVIQDFRKQQEARPHETITDVILHVPESDLPFFERHRIELETFGRIKGLQIRPGQRPDISLQYDART